MIDALLAAFPALGLAKIVWAIDVILALELPEFSRHGAATAQWHDLAATRSIPLGQTRRVECDGRAVFAHRGAQGWRVYDSRCPHQDTELPQLDPDGNTLGLPAPWLALRRPIGCMHGRGRQATARAGVRRRQGPPACVLVSPQRRAGAIASSSTPQQGDIP